MNHPSLADVQRDWRVLDQTGWSLPPGVRLLSHEKFSFCDEAEVEHIAPGPTARMAENYSKLLSAFLYSFKLLRRTPPNAVLILNGGGVLWLFAGLLNRFLFFPRRIVLCWDIFVEVGRGWKRSVVGLAMRGMTLCVLWSRAQVQAHAEFLKMPGNRFVFLPFKANHSKGPAYDLPIGNFVFAGGNGKRDYRCLTEAVRDTGIPVIISATDPAVRREIEPLPNVIVLAASEPDFAKLQAASRFVVLPVTFTGLKGGGEANFCNGMWHGKPVIAADSMAAEDYILDGETGFVVPAGDVEGLRARIVELWNEPEKVERMGAAAQRHVRAHFTHRAFIRRLLWLATVLGAESRGVPSGRGPEEAGT